jgi:hypothetical protein
MSRQGSPSRVWFPGFLLVALVALPVGMALSAGGGWASSALIERMERRLGVRIAVERAAWDKPRLVYTGVRIQTPAGAELARAGRLAVEAALDLRGAGLSPRRVELDDLSLALDRKSLAHFEGIGERLERKLGQKPGRTSNGPFSLQLRSAKIALGDAAELRDLNLSANYVKPPLGDALVSGSAGLRVVRLKHSLVSKHPLRDLRLGMEFRIEIDSTGRAIVLAPVKLMAGAAKLSVEGQLRLDGPAFDLSWELAPADCDRLLASLPANFRTRLKGVRLLGRLGLSGRWVLDPSRPAATRFSVEVDGQCRVGDRGSLPGREDLRKAFSYTVRPKKEPTRKRAIGPGTSDWVPLEAISPVLVEAVVLAEDGRYWQHGGINPAAMAWAMRISLEQGRIAAGGSTIPMQLARTLFLAPERSMARKVQEIGLAWYLEQVLDKREILALYLNAVEWGPDVYGIGQAARQHFNRAPADLSGYQAAILACLLPSPVRLHQRLISSQATADDRSIRDRLLRRMHERGLIDRQDLAAWLALPMVLAR